VSFTPCTLASCRLNKIYSDVGCKTVANMIKGKTPEEIRKLFNIVNDFTPEEEAQIKKENVGNTVFLLQSMHLSLRLGMG
jgi:hypothetical protein